MKYKIRFYHLSGSEKGNMSKEEFYDTFHDAALRLREVFKPGLLALNATLWVADSSYADGWHRLTNQEITEMWNREDVAGANG